MHSYERMAYLGRTHRAIPLGWMPVAIIFQIHFGDLGTFQLLVRQRKVTGLF